MWPIPLVIGLLTVAGIISVIYMWWETTRAGYHHCPIVPGQINVLGRLAPIDDPTVEASADDEALLVVYSSHVALDPFDLSSKFEDLVASEYPDYEIAPISVPLEPGYNVRYALDKQMRWLHGAKEAWVSSAFRACIMPIELFLRWSFLPTWIILDFFAHVGKCYAALLIPSASRERGRRYAIPETKFIESYTGLYSRTTVPTEPSATLAEPVNPAVDG